VPMEAEITTPQAADLLNVSPLYIGGLADKGALPARMAGNQRRALWLHRGCSQGHLAADLQRAAESRSVRAGSPGNIVYHKRKGRV
jgi:excisionase family DNA binding protein